MLPNNSYGAISYMGKKIRKIWNVLSSVIVVLVVVLAIALAGVRLIGFRVFTVLSGSMEPTFQTGSLIYVKNADPTELRAGDVITYMLNEDTVATHRIVEVLSDPQRPSLLQFRTKGDANNAVDALPVLSENVIGKPVFAIPKMGYFASYIQKPPGLYVAVAVGAFLLLLVFLPNIFGKSSKKKGKREKRANLRQNQMR